MMFNSYFIKLLMFTVKHWCLPKLLNQSLNGIYIVPYPVHCISETITHPYNYNEALMTIKAPFLGAADGWKVYLGMYFARPAVWSFLPTDINKPMNIIYLTHLGVGGCPSAPLRSAAVFEVGVSVRNLLQLSPTCLMMMYQLYSIKTVNTQYSQWIFTWMHWLLTKVKLFIFSLANKFQEVGESVTRGHCTLRIYILQWSVGLFLLAGDWSLS